MSVCARGSPRCPRPRLGSWAAIHTSGRSWDPHAPPPCTPSPEAKLTGVRLVGGKDKYRGRLEVLYGGRWGSVCNGPSPPLFLDAAQTACRQLGFAGGRPADFGPAKTTPILLGNVYCYTSLPSLANCSFTAGPRVKKCMEQYGNQAFKLNPVGVICTSEWAGGAAPRSAATHAALRCETESVASHACREMMVPALLLDAFKTRPPLPILHSPRADNDFFESHLFITTGSNFPGSRCSRHAAPRRRLLVGRGCSSAWR